MLEDSRKMTVEYIDEIAKPEVFVRGPVYAKDRETDTPVFATSDTKQIGYLKYRGIEPQASVERRWKTQGKERKKIFMIYNDSSILRKILDDLKHNIGGAKELLEAYDYSRNMIRQLSRT